jgi:hypothetical protein
MPPWRKRHLMSPDQARELVEEIAAKYDGFTPLSPSDEEMIRDLVLEHGGPVASFALVNMPAGKNRKKAPKNATREEHNEWLASTMLPFDQWTREQWSKAINGAIWTINRERQERQRWDDHVAGGGASWGPKGDAAFANEMRVRDALIQAAEELGAEEATETLEANPLAVISSYALDLGWSKQSPDTIYVISDGRPSLDPYRDANMVFVRALELLDETGDAWSWDSHNAGVQFFHVTPAVRANGGEHQGARAQIDRWLAARARFQAHPSRQTASAYLQITIETHRADVSLATSVNKVREEVSAYLGRDGARINPAPDVDAAALEKYEEFHRFPSKKIIRCPKLTIPTRVRLGGAAKHVMYRSNKVDPGTMEKPKRHFDYIHEHDAGVRLYLVDDGGELDIDVPAKFRPDPNTDPALVVLGQCLGFAFTDPDGELVEGTGKQPYPDLLCTPDGKCLYVVQSGKKVLAMMWGGALGVFARGIDG